MKRGIAIQDHLPLTKEQRAICHTLQAQAPKPEYPVIPSRLPPAEISRGTAFFWLRRISMTRWSLLTFSCSYSLYASKMRDSVDKVARQERAEILDIAAGFCSLSHATQDPVTGSGNGIPLIPHLGCLLI